MPNTLDSTEIRIWPIQYFDFAKRVIILKKNKYWKGYLYYSYTSPVVDQDGTKVQMKDNFHIGDSVFVVKEFAPICGWMSFGDSVRNLIFENLPTQDSIPGFERKGIRDGNLFVIEISHLNSYKVVRYSNPSAYIDSTNRKFIAFLEMIKRQLGVNYNWPGKN